MKIRFRSKIRRNVLLRLYDTVFRLSLCFTSGTWVKRKNKIRTENVHMTFLRSLLGETVDKVKK